MSSCIDKVTQWKQTNRADATAKAASLSFEPNLQFFSASRASILQHPKVKDISASSQKELLVFQLYNFLEFLIWAEQGPVTYVCGQLSSGRYPIQLSKDLVEGASIIRTQEANHSIWAYRLLLGVEAVTKNKPFPIPPLFVRSMEGAIDKQKDLGDLIQLMYVIIAEVIDLGTFETIRLDPTVQGAVRDFAGDHEFEEKLHRVYFRRLFEQVWVGLPADLQERIGFLLPEILISLLGFDQQVTRLILDKFPDDIEHPDTIVQDMVGAEGTEGSIRKGAREVLMLIQNLGILSNPRVAHVFRTHNLMPDEFGVLSS